MSFAAPGATVKGAIPDTIVNSDSFAPLSEVVATFRSAKPSLLTRNVVERPSPMLTKP